MASQGPNFPSTATDDASVGTVAWTNPGNALTSNDSRATAALANQTSHYLVTTGYGFAVPAGATIVGIEVDIEKSTNANPSPATVIDNAVRLVKAGTIGTTDRANTTDLWPSSVAEATVVYGGATDMWGTTWTPSDINNANFGAALSAVKTAAGATTCRVDAISITAYYTTTASVQNLGLITAAATVQAMTRTKYRSVGLASGAGSLFALGRSKRTQIGRVTVFDVIRALVNVHSAPNLIGPFTGAVRAADAGGDIVTITDDGTILLVTDGGVVIPATSDGMLV